MRMPHITYCMYYCTTVLVCTTFVLVRNILLLVYDSACVYGERDKSILMDVCTLSLFWSGRGHWVLVRTAVRTIVLLFQDTDDGVSYFRKTRKNDDLCSHFSRCRNLSSSVSLTFVHGSAAPRPGGPVDFPVEIPLKGAAS